VLSKLVLCALLFLSAFQLPSVAQTTSGKEKSPNPKAADSPPAKPGSVETRVEQYLRNLYAWGPTYEVKVGPSKPSPIPDLLEVPVTVSLGGQSDTAVVYVSKTGNFLLRGDLTDMSVDPFADTRSKLHVGNSPSMGPEDAKVTLIEFADFECPSCRQLDLVLRDLLPQYPEVRLVFKHYPLTDIHPWAMTAAIASQCAYQQNPAAFWKMHDAIFDAQDVISPSNVWDKLLDLATQQGLNAEAYRACMINPETASQVKASIEEGHALTITATPTTFVNSRRVVGPDKTLIEQYVKFSLTNKHSIAYRTICVNGDVCLFGWE
jgi:protein-disulfide isomerase